MKKDFNQKDVVSGISAEENVRAELRRRELDKMMEESSQKKEEQRMKKEMEERRREKEREDNNDDVFGL